MEYPLARRRRAASTSPSPRLVRSRSGAENNSNSLNSSQRLTNRSKSTTGPRSTKNEENTYSSRITSSKFTGRKPSQENSSKDGFVRFLPGRTSASRNSLSTPTRPNSASGSPSAWALSPGRTSWLNVLPPESPGNCSRPEREKVKGRGVSSVLKYFRQKKASPIQEEDYHKYKVLYNRLLQWRFVNARAEAAMSSATKVAEDRLFHVWLRIINTRNFILERRMEIQKLKNDIKLCEIVNPQMHLLNEWPKIEGRNCEAVSRMTRKLSALSVKLPLVEDAEGDVESVYEAMKKAVDVMDVIEVTIIEFHLQVEKVLYLLTELTSNVEHQEERLEEMEKTVTLVAKLLACERSVRAHLMQVVME